MPATKRPKQRSIERTAIHEAGHAVLSFHLSRGVARVSVVPADDALGMCTSTPFPAWLQPDVSMDARARAWLEREILILLGGVAAEAKLTGRHNWSAAHQDRACAVDLAMYVCGSPEEAGAYVQWLFLRAKGLLENPDRWRAVARIAAALVERREISGHQARQLYAAGMRERFEEAHP